MTSSVVALDQTTDVDMLDLGVTWYPTNRIGLGVGYGRQSVDFDGGSEIDADSYRVSLDWFFTESVRVGLAHAWREEQFGAETETVGDLSLRVGIRW